jgi:hypothetical protein
MDDKLGKSRRQGAEARAAGAAPKPRTARKPAGRVVFDDRGNKVWEWAPNLAEAKARREEDRLRLLDNSSLSILDETTPGPSGRGPVARSAGGYNPYDSGRSSAKGAAAVPPTKAGRKDLRKLGEWLALRSKMGLHKKT